MRGPRRTNKAKSDKERPALQALLVTKAANTTRGRSRLEGRKTSQAGLPVTRAAPWVTTSKAIATEKKERVLRESLERRFTRELDYQSKDSAAKIKIPSKTTSHSQPMSVASSLARNSKTA